MALYLREEDVYRLLTMEEAIAAVEQALADLALGRADNHPRMRSRARGAVLHTMGAVWEREGVMGFKAYSSVAGEARFLVGLFSLASGELLALMEGEWLGRVRTGAASGVATRHMARADAATLGVLGTGRQAETQVLAVCAVRPIREVKVYGRDPWRREEFCRRLEGRVAARLVPVLRPEEAAEADVVCTATSAREPLFPGEAVRAGTHVNAVGSNAWLRREIDDQLVERAAVIAVDDAQQARVEAGDLIWPAERGRLSWHRVVELGHIVAGRAAGRTGPEDITLFSSQGIALEDVAVAARVLRRAQEEGAGQVLEFRGMWPH